MEKMIKSLTENIEEAETFEQKKEIIKLTAMIYHIGGLMNADFEEAPERVNEKYEERDLVEDDE